MPDKVATYSLNLDSNTAAVSKEAAAGLEDFRSKIATSTTFIKEMQGSLRNLRGSSDAVMAAKKSLKAQIEAERGVISQASLAIVAQGKTYDVLAKAAKAAEVAAKGLSDAEKAAGAPLKDLVSKVELLGARLTTVTGISGLALLGTAALAAGFAYLSEKAVAAALDVGKFVLVGNDAARSMSLQREATNGSAENAKNWGTQIDALRRKVSTSTEDLNKLSVSLSKSLSGGQSVASGQAIVDTFNAVGEAADAMGDDAGGAIEGIIAEGKRFGRIGLDPSTLQGKWNTGWEDISKAVAKNLNVSLGAAKLALAQHRVTLDSGAKAIRDAVEARFGEINAKKLISLDSLSKTLHDDWVNLTKGFNLDPVLEGMKKVVDLFDSAHVEGDAIKSVFTSFGTLIGSNVGTGVSVAKYAVDEFVIALLELEIWVLKNKGMWKKAFDDEGGIEGLKKEAGDLLGDMKDLAAAAWDVAKAIGAVAKGAGWVSDHLGKEWGSAIFKVQDHFADNDAKAAAYSKSMGDTDRAPGVGTDMSAGVAKGVTDGAGEIDKAMVDAVKGGLAAARGPEGADAHSPSRKAAVIGGDISEGAAEGVERGAPAMSDAMAGIMSPRAAGGAGSAGVGRGTHQGGGVQLHFHLAPGAGGAQARDAIATLSAPSFLRELELAARAAGIPTMSPSP